VSAAAAVERDLVYGDGADGDEVRHEATEVRS
jgi:hypothetical protein